MSALSSLPISLGSPPPKAWQQVADAVAGWAEVQGLALRDVVVVVPFAQLLDPARRAFADRGGWLPRIETTSTLQRSLGPAPPMAAGAMTGSAVTDQLQMAQLLRGIAGMAAWEQRDPRSFGQAVADAVDAAHRLARAAACHAPAAREQFWNDARRCLAPVGGPGELDAALARAALEWARLAPAPASDALFGLGAAGWVVVRAGGTDPLAEAVASHAAAPALCVNTDPPDESPWQAAATGAAAARLVETEGLEEEARATAIEVLGALAAGRAPVALIALDRVLMRRVRALLERRVVAIADETGWALSTTRAAARVMAMLRAARRGAGADERLEWIKVLPADRAPPDAVQRLESAWRAGRALDPQRDLAAVRTGAWAADVLEPLRSGVGLRRRPLIAWLAAAGAVLAASGVGELLRADAAGQQLLTALALGPGAVTDAARAAALAAEVVELDGFAAWVDGVIEGASFIAPAPASPEVVLTPLARAILRPFGAVVMAGADESRLGASAPGRGLIGPADAAALGLDTRDDRLRQERAAFIQLLRAGPVTLVRRRVEGDEPVGESPFVAAWSLAREQAGLAPLAAAAGSRPAREVAATPVQRPAPAPGGMLPPELSATAVERLRQCPYRFFTRSVLGLGEADELGRELDKRDYGNWLHDLLDRFHRGRDPAGDDGAALRRAADAAMAAAGLDAAALLPFRASFERLLPAYLEWLQARDAAGLRWDSGESTHMRQPPELGGLRLAGRIDRIDRGADGSLELIDYKTGAAENFAKTLRANRYEDTQLAFYALLLEADSGVGPAVRASYLPLDGAGAIAPIEHPEVAASARALLAGLAHDLDRIRAGAGLPALGEGRTCQTCEARGLCRRDHWHGQEHQP